MEIGMLKRHLPSVEDGRWVDGEEIRDLRDIRVKVRGAGSTAAKAEYARRERAAPDRDRTAKGELKPEAYIRLITEMLRDWHLIDIEGLTLDGEPLTVQQVKDRITEPEFSPLADLLMMAVAAVDQTREAQIEAISGN